MTTRRLVAAAVCAEQVIDLIDRGVTQFHFYTMNRADLVYAICHLVGLRPRGRPSSFPRSSRASLGDEPALPTLDPHPADRRRRARAARRSARRWRAPISPIDLVEARTLPSRDWSRRRREHFDCVLLDCRPGGLDGADYLAQLTSPEGGRQAVIALTDRPTTPTPWRCCAPARSIRSSRGEADAATLARAIRYAKARRAFVVDLHAARERRGGEIARARPAEPAEDADPVDHRARSAQSAFRCCSA